MLLLKYLNLSLTSTNGCSIDLLLSDNEAPLLLGTPYVSQSVSDTIRFGKAFAKRLKPNDVVACIGDLGAGKTHFIKGVTQNFAVAASDVTSPTFIYVNHYETPSHPLFHFDLYRLTKAQDFYAMGFDEYFSKKGICLIEWPNIIITALPTNTYFVHLEHMDENSRKIHITHKD